MSIEDLIGPGPSGATFSSCRKHRFTLWRRWEPDCPPSRMCAFIGLNPSTADETLDDPTIRRCIRFSKDWGFGGYVMLNLFSFRATDPKVMKADSNPCLQANLKSISEVSDCAGRVVCAWGTHGSYEGLGETVRTWLSVGRFVNLWHLGLTKQGFPKHPLYLKADTQPQIWLAQP